MSDTTYRVMIVLAADLSDEVMGRQRLDYDFRNGDLAVESDRGRRACAPCPR